MASDSAHEFLTHPDSDGGDRLGHAPDFDEVEWEASALEREAAAAEFLRLANEHRKVCGALHLRYGDVTADDLARASLSDEPDIQCARLGPLFKMCGLLGDGHEIERADLLKTIADAGPQSEAEMRLLFQVTAAEYMAVRCAADAMQPGQDPSVMSLQIGNFSKLTRLGFDLRDGLQKLRSAQSPSRRVLDAGPAPLPAAGHTKALPAGADGRDTCEAHSPPDADACGRRVPLAGRVWAPALPHARRGTGLRRA
jgi:hypothetical protein